MKFDRLNREKHLLLEKNARLQLKASNLASSKRIESLAQSRYMLKYVERSDLVPIIVLPEYRAAYRERALENDSAGQR